jgi:hypothetical protein
MYFDCVDDEHSKIRFNKTKNKTNKPRYGKIKSFAEKYSKKI